jgi:hypothetical protein
LNQAAKRPDGPRMRDLLLPRMFPAHAKHPKAPIATSFEQRPSSNQVAASVALLLDAGCPEAYIAIEVVTARRYGEWTAGAGVCAQESWWGSASSPATSPGLCRAAL